MNDIPDHGIAQAIRDAFRSSDWTNRGSIEEVAESVAAGLDAVAGAIDRLDSLEEAAAIVAGGMRAVATAIDGLAGAIREVGGKGDAHPPRIPQGKPPSNPPADQSPRSTSHDE